MISLKSDAMLLHTTINPAVPRPGDTPAENCETIPCELMITPGGVLGPHVYTRELMRFGNQAPLLPGRTTVPRKPHAAYGELVGPALLKAYPGCATIFLVGDSITSDGVAARGFRAAGIPTAFFCCDPKIRITGNPLDMVWDGDTLLTVMWDDLGTFVTQHPWVLNPTSLLVVDLDNTLWTPAGIADHAAIQVRDGAILEILGRDMPGTLASRRQRCLDALGLLKAGEFQVLCADDEERNALLAAAAAMTGFEMTGEMPGLFPTPEAYAAFLRKCIATAGTTDPFKQVLESLTWIIDEMMTQGSECIWARLRGDIHTAITRLESGEATTFPAFRDAQRELSIDAADPSRTMAGRFMANRAVVDLIRMAKGNGCRAVGLTDRPALAIFPEADDGKKGRSLWTTPMGLAGPALFGPRTMGSV